MIEEVNPYANYSSMVDLSYNIIDYLINEPKADIIWKLLKYEDSNAYTKPSLTNEEKRALIYKGQPNQSDYSIFFDYMMDDAEYKMKTILRIYPAEVYPLNRTNGICTINIEVYVHSQINHLANYKTRVDVIIQKILEILNGKYVGGIGVLFFDNQASRYDKVQTIGQKPYKGKLLKMSVNMG